MGYSLLNLGRDLAVGGLKRNRELTQESQKLRREELAANRALAMEEVKKDNDSRRKDYDEEIKKFKVVDSLNKKYQGQEGIDREAFGREYLLATNPKHFDSVIKAYAKQPQKLASVFESYGQQGNTSFTVSTTKEALQQKYKEQSEAITANFTKQIKEAKGDDFLVSKALALRDKLLGKVKEEETSGDTTGTNAAVETSNAIKAAGLETKGDFTFGDISKKRLLTPDEKYQTEWSTEREKIKFDTTNENSNVFKFLNETAKLGGNDDISYKFNKTDGQIEKMNPPAQQNLLAMQFMFDKVKNSKDTMTLHYNKVTKNTGDISKTWNTNTVFNKMSDLLDGRGGNIQQKGFNGITDYRLTTFIPLSLVDQNNEMTIGDKVINFKDKAKMKQLNNVMNDYIIKKTDALYSQDKKVDEQSHASRVYSRLYKGDTNTMNEFLQYAAGKDANLFKNINENLKPKDGSGKVSPPDILKPKSKKITYKVGVQNGEEGLTINGKFKSWEEIQKADAVKDLDKKQELEYLKWKNKNTETNPSYMRPSKP